MYPPDKKMPNGKIRLVYEANPLAMIIEQAGGKAIDGQRRILDIKPESIHQRVPFYAGSVDEVELLEKFLNE
jgi:fructose-1,6-bisphosphatase I